MQDSIRCDFCLTKISNYIGSISRDLDKNTAKMDHKDTIYLARPSSLVSFLINFHETQDHCILHTHTHSKTHEIHSCDSKKNKTRKKTSIKTTSSSTESSIFISSHLATIKTSGITSPLLIETKMLN